MYRIALRMLLRDRARSLGMILGLAFASLLITQQAAIFTGLMARSYGFLNDAAVAEVWVMDPEVAFIDEVKPMRRAQLYRVRGVRGVGWALPLYRNMLPVKLEDGTFQRARLVGLDDATLAGGPPRLVEGELLHLRRPDAVIVDARSARTKLARTGPRGGKVPLRVGDVLEINDHRAVVVGLCEVSPTFQDFPVVYATWSLALAIAPPVRKNLSFVMVKPADGVAAEALCERIERATGLKAWTRDRFAWETVRYWMRETGIPINFGIAVVLGFIVGAAVVGQTLYHFTVANLSYLAAFKAMGARAGLLVRMLVLQAFVVGGLGFGLGVGVAALIGFATGDDLAFKLPWQLLLGSAGAIAVICLGAAALSAWRVVRLDPALVFQAA